METFIILLTLELFELFWQKGGTFFDYTKTLFTYYRKSLILFICLHPTLYFVLYLYMQSGSNALLIILILKSLDLGVKIFTMDKIGKEQMDLSHFTNLNLPIQVKIIPMLFYLFVFSFSLT